PASSRRGPAAAGQRRIKGSSAASAWSMPRARTSSMAASRAASHGSAESAGRVSADSVGEEPERTPPSGGRTTSDQYPDAAQRRRKRSASIEREGPREGS